MNDFVNHGDILLNAEDIDRLKSLFAESEEEYPIADNAQAGELLATDTKQRQPSDRLFDLLVTKENTGYSRRFIIDLANHFFLSQVIENSGLHIAEVLNNLAAYIPGQVQPDGSNIKPFPMQQGEQLPTYVQAYIQPLDFRMEWKEALMTARASAKLNRFPFSDARTKAVAEAATRMQQRGYHFTLDCGTFLIQTHEVEKIMADIGQLLRQLGCVDALAQIINLSRNTYECAYGQILFGPKYALGLGERPPAVPVGLLFNIAVKLPLRGTRHSLTRRRAAWDKAIALARDFAAMLDLESYSQFTFMNADISQIEVKLRQAAHYDHCFTIRQWHFNFTSEFLANFFGLNFNAEMKQKLGWDVSDILNLTDVLSDCVKQYPSVIPVQSLTNGGIQPKLVDCMLPYLTHAECEANKNYRSPFDAAGLNMMLRPAIWSKDKHNLIFPTDSSTGPAIFEAVFDALKEIANEAVISKLRGEGTERLTNYVFKKYGFSPTFEDAKYDLGGSNNGECDLVFEDDENIIFVECKAKALTRGAMTGNQGDALLDFAGSVFASQAQALKHERILRTLGEICFPDGRCLAFRNRRITRLTVTLVDHGMLQNQWVLNSFYQALLSMQVSCSSDYSKKKQVDDFNKNLQIVREEMKQLLAAGLDFRVLSLTASSASIAQLDVILNGAQSIGNIAQRLLPRISYSTFNILLEYFYIKKMRTVAVEQARCIGKTTVDDDKDLPK